MIFVAFVQCKFDLKLVNHQTFRHDFAYFFMKNVLFSNLFKLDFKGLPVEIEENVRSKRNSIR